MSEYSTRMARLAAWSMRFNVSSNMRLRSGGRCGCDPPVSSISMQVIGCEHGCCAAHSGL